MLWLILMFVLSQFWLKSSLQNCGQQMRIGGLADFSAHPPPMTEKEKMMDDHYVRVNQMRVSSNYDELTFGDDDTPEPQRALKM